jgi:hypothetical protein
LPAPILAWTPSCMDTSTSGPGEEVVMECRGGALTSRWGDVVCTSRGGMWCAPAGEVMWCAPAGEVMWCAPAGEVMWRTGTLHPPRPNFRKHRH